MSFYHTATHLVNYSIHTHTHTHSYKHKHKQKSHPRPVFRWWIVNHIHVFAQVLSPKRNNWDVDLLLCSLCSLINLIITQNLTQESPELCTQCDMHGIICMNWTVPSGREGKEKSRLQGREKSKWQKWRGGGIVREVIDECGYWWVTLFPTSPAILQTDFNHTKLNW